MAAGSRGLTYDWQNKYQTNGERLKHAFVNGLFTDCEFLVGSDEGNELIKANKVILATGSPVFEAMFYGEMATTQNAKPVEVLDVQPETFKHLLEFMYSEQISISSFDQACELRQAADKYMVPGLVNMCSQYADMWKNLSPDTACRALEFANLYEGLDLKSKSLDIIRCRTRQALESTSFDEITESTLLILVKDDELSVTEIELFDAIIRWGLKECERKEDESSSSKLREVLTNVLSHIRFLTMTPEEFTKGPAWTGILQLEESHAIMMNIGLGREQQTNKWPMPTHLSSLRDARGVYHAPTTSFKNNAAVGPSYMRSLQEDHRQNRLYCYRHVSGESLVRNNGILHSAVSLTVDRDVRIHGIVIASEVAKNDEESDNSSYVELLYCHLLDRDGTYLAFAHLHSRASELSTLDMLFSRAVRVQRNREYLIRVLRNRGGYYPVGTASMSVITEGVHFQFGSPDATAEMFGTSAGNDDGIIRGVIFSL